MRSWDLVVSKTAQRNCSMLLSLKRHCLSWWLIDGRRALSPWFNWGCEYFTTTGNTNCTVCSILNVATCICLSSCLRYVQHVPWSMPWCMIDEIMRPYGSHNSTATSFHSSFIEDTLPKCQARRRPRSALAVIHFRLRILYNRSKHQLHSLIDIECGYSKTYAQSLCSG